MELRSRWIKSGGCRPGITMHCEIVRSVRILEEFMLATRHLAYVHGKASMLLLLC
jgi:hypothetical protein